MEACMELYDLLEHLGISYQEVEHAPVWCVEQAQFIKQMISGVGCKSLFLTDRHRYFLVMLKEEKRVSMKNLAQALHVSHLSMASEEDLKRILGLEPGSVTPLSLFRDTNHLVTVILDKSLENQSLLCHSCVNTKTMSIAYHDLLRWIMFTGHEYQMTEVAE